VGQPGPATRYETQCTGGLSILRTSPPGDGNPLGMPINALSSGLRRWEPANSGRHIHLLKRLKNAGNLPILSGHLGVPGEGSFIR
jgi:hypothetical protein